MDFQPVISLKEVSFSYSSLAVLEHINLSVNQGDMVSIVGPNGGGKTTLLKLMLGLLVPDRGKILVNGRDPRENSRDIGYVPQYSRFDEKFPITVFEVVLTGRLTKSIGFYSKRDREAVREALDTAGLLNLSDRPFQALSGGQRQRVLIARALVSRPSILFLDEPTSNVDAAVGNMLQELLEKLNEDLTILLVTHDVGFVHSITNRVFCVNRIAHEHPVEKLDPSLISAAYGSKIGLVRHDINIEESE